MNEPRYRHNAGCVFSLKYHLVWCPKYRRKVLVGEIAEELRSLLNQKARELDIPIEALEIIPDDVHLLIQRSQTEAPLHLGKLRQKFPQLRSRLPSCGAEVTPLAPLATSAREPYCIPSKCRN